MCIHPICAHTHVNLAFKLSEVSTVCKNEDKQHPLFEVQILKPILFSSDTVNTPWGNIRLVNLRKGMEHSGRVAS